MDDSMRSYSNNSHNVIYSNNSHNVLPFCTLHCLSVRIRPEGKEMVVGGGIGSNVRNRFAEVLLKTG